MHPYPEYGHPVQLQDAAKAVKFFRHRAQQFNIHAGRLAIWGESSGATIGGWLAYGPDLAQPGGEPQQQKSTRPQALINMSGLTNFTLMSPAYPSMFTSGLTLGDHDTAFLESVSVSHMVGTVPRLFTPPVASLYGASENPPPLTDPHDATLMKDLHARLQAFPDAASKSLMLQQSAVPTNLHDKLAAWLLQRMAVPHQLDVGHGLAGTGGAVPKLKATGQWSPGGSALLSFQTSTGRAESTWIILGQTRVSLPFKGGVLVPTPVVVEALPVSATGAAVIHVALPGVLVSGNEFYMQCWQVDRDAPAGFAASNGVLALIAP